MNEYRCDKCGYFLAERDKPADVRVKIICRNCRKHHVVDLSQAPKPAMQSRGLRFLAA